ncbi:unnamed protein product [Paramecium primaurelia]|uniref:Transmembrane protein n=1 Tax=Paramecium primaurelia TaxID=5886 RepID=A0A8S1N5E8_PARPR|nr:unnamed protein product [Paramecium primaurelia]
MLTKISQSSTLKQQNQLKQQNYLNQQQLSQIVKKIEIVQRPLASGESLEIKQNGNPLINKFKEWFGQVFFHHYAIILNTKENEQFILHQLKDGFISTEITDEQRQKEYYTVNQSYDSSQLVKQFTVKELQDQNPQEYSVVSNSCIHYVNRVIDLLNQNLKDVNTHVLERIEQKNLIVMARTFIQNAYQAVTQQKIKEALIQKLKNPTLHNEILYELIRTSKNQTPKQIFGNCVIIAIAQILNVLTNQIQHLSVLLSVPTITFGLYFIWSQSDESIFKKCVKSLHLLFFSLIGVPLLRDLCDFISDLCKELQIIKIGTKETLFLGGCTITGVIGGAFIEYGYMPNPITSLSNLIATLQDYFQQYHKPAVQSTSACISGGEPACISDCAYATDLCSVSSSNKPDSDQICTQIESKETQPLLSGLFEKICNSSVIQQIKTEYLKPVVQLTAAYISDREPAYISGCEYFSKLCSVSSSNKPDSDQICTSIESEEKYGNSKVVTAVNNYSVIKQIKTGAGILYESVCDKIPIVKQFLITQASNPKVVGGLVGFAIGAYLIYKYWKRSDQK